MYAFVVKDLEKVLVGGSDGANYGNRDYFADSIKALIEKYGAKAEKEAAKEDKTPTKKPKDTSPADTKTSSDDVGSTGSGTGGSEITGGTTSPPADNKTPSVA